MKSANITHVNESLNAQPSADRINNTRSGKEALPRFVWVGYEERREATELYEQILEIERPWFVKSVVVDEAALIVDVYLEHEAGPDWFPCPQCHQTVPVYDHLKARVWRHRDTCQ